MRNIADELSRVREKLEKPAKERKPFEQRLKRACQKDRELNEIVFGDEPATTTHRKRLLYRCAYWRFDVHETVTLLEMLDARTGESE